MAHRRREHFRQIKAKRTQEPARSSRNGQPIQNRRSLGRIASIRSQGKAMSQSSRPSQTSRRKFLRGAAVVTAATVTAPTVVSAQGPISMRWQSTWPAKDIFPDCAPHYAKKCNGVTGRDLKIAGPPAGAVVPASQLLDAVSKGTLDG